MFLISYFVFVVVLKKKKERKKSKKKSKKKSVFYFSFETRQNPSCPANGYFLKTRIEIDGVFSRLRNLSLLFALPQLKKIKKIKRSHKETIMKDNERGSVFITCYKHFLHNSMRHGMIEGILLLLLHRLLWV